jgi:hypothetical protein
VSAAKESRTVSLIDLHGPVLRIVRSFYGERLMGTSIELMTPAVYWDGDTNANVPADLKPAMSAQANATDAQCDVIAATLMPPNSALAMTSKRLEQLVAKVNALLPLVDSEIEQRKFSGNQEDWHALEQLVAEVREALP